MISELTEAFELKDRERFEFEALMRIHIRLGNAGAYPPTMVGMENTALMSYITAAYGLISDTPEFDSSTPQQLFQTTLLMGLCLGVQLEKERHG